MWFTDVPLEFRISCHRRETGFFAHFAVMATHMYAHCPSVEYTIYFRIFSTKIGFISTNIRSISVKIDLIFCLISHFLFLISS
jgi:hypothetical protein